MTDLSIRVAASLDDGHAHPSFVFGTEAALLAGQSGSSYRLYARFLNVTIPKGATINSAVIRFRASASDSGSTCNLRIQAEDADDAGQITNSADLNGRTLTSGYVDWSSVGSWTSGNDYDSPDFASVLQAIVNRSGWASGNALQIHVTNNGSSEGAYRRPVSYNGSSSTAPLLVVTYEVGVLADLTDGSGVGDAVDGFSLTTEIADGAGVGDAVEGYDYKGEISETVGIAAQVAAYAEREGAATGGAGIGDTVSSDGEIDAQFDDIVGVADDTDGFNWTQWLAGNREFAVTRFYLTITGENDLTTDIEIPMSSFQARKRTENPTYVSVVVPFTNEAAAALEARANGEIVIEMAYLVDGQESVREEILRADLEQINLQQGTSSRSIMLIGHKTIAYANQDTQLSSPTYKYTSDGRRGFRFASPDPYLNPGDTAIVGDEEFTVDSVLYLVSAGSGQTVMEVQE